MSATPPPHVWFVRGRDYMDVYAPVRREGWLLVLACFLSFCATMIATGLVAFQVQRNEAWIFAGGTIVGLCVIFGFSRVMRAHADMSINVADWREMQKRRGGSA